MEKNARRNLLKSITVVAPVAWTHPVIDTVMLPAHAQISFSCGSATAIDVEPPPGGPNGQNMTDAVEVVFDCFSCAVNTVDDLDGPSADSIAFLDVDNPGLSDPANFDAKSLGGDNWNVSDFDGNGPSGENASSNNSESRIYSLVATRTSGPCAGQSFRVFLDIEVITQGGPEDGSGTINVSASISPMS